MNSKRPEEESETDTEELLQRFETDFILYVLSRGVPAALGLIGLIFLTHRFSPSVYGQYALAIMFVYVFSELFFGWLEQAVLRFESENGTEVIISHIFLLVSVISIIIVILGLNIYYFLTSSINIYERFFLPALVLTIATGVFMVFRALFQAQFKPGSITRFKMYRSVLQVIFGVVFILYIFNDIIGWLWGFALATVVTIGVMIRQLPSANPFSNFNPEISARMLRYGFPMLFWLFGLTLLNFIDRLLLELLVGSTAVGVYSSNYTIINNGLPLILTPIIQAVHPVVMDAWEGNNVEEIQDLLYEYTRYYFIIGIPSVVIFSILSYPLSHILLGRGFEEGYIVMPIVALGLFFWNLSMIGHKSYELKERTEIMSAGVFGAVIINICLNIPFIYYYGYTGAAIATLLSFLFYLVFAYLISHQEIPWKLPANSIINSSFSGILMTIPPMVLYLLDLHSYVLIIISAGVSIIIYIISMASTNEIEKEELKMMWKDKL